MNDRWKSMLRGMPGLGRLIDSQTQLAHDHLALVAAYHALEHAKTMLEVERQQLLQDYRLLERRFTTLSEPWFAHVPDEPQQIDQIAVPHPLLRYWVAGHEDLGWFLQGGSLGAQVLAEILQRRQIELATLHDILDFGCGCGRVLRYLPKLTNARLAGTDLNAEAIAWSSAHLPFAEFSTNQVTPPLPYAAHRFDLIYAFSIFTHFTAELQNSWMQELRRMLKQGGYLVISVHGDAYREHLNTEELQAYAAGQLVVQHRLLRGQNICGAFHSEAYVRGGFARNFQVLEHWPQGAKGNPHQDLYLLQAS